MLVEDIVVGHSIEALMYAVKNNYNILLTSCKGPYFFENFLTPTGRSINLRELWSRNKIKHSLDGKVFSFRELDQVRVKEGELHISAKGAYKIIFNKCYIVDTERVTHAYPALEVKPESYQVVDDFELRRIPRNFSTAPLSQTNKSRGFVNEVIFYTSGRVSGAKHFTDCVTVSNLSKEQIYDVDYSDIYIKFMLEDYLRDLGIRGKIVGTNKDGTKKFHKPEVKHVKRLLRRIENNRFKGDASVCFTGKISLGRILNCA